MTETQRDLTSVTLSIGAIGALTAASFLTLRPFVGAAIWATMIVVATWPMLLRLQSRLGNRRGAAVAVMSVGILLLFVLPFTAAVVTIADGAGPVTEWVSRVEASGLPPAPTWLLKVPAVGGQLSDSWNGLATSGPGGLVSRIEPYASRVLQWSIEQLGNVGRALVQFLITLVLATIMFANGEAAVTAVRAFCVRLIGERGHAVVHLAGQAIRGVALGVVVTSLVQATLGGIGLAVVGVPYAAVLAVVIFLGCVAQLGPLPVLLIAVVWRYATGETGWAIALLLWTLGIGSLDYILRPYLMRKGADLPMLLIVGGVIGGVLSFGLLGIFVGPVVLAVTYTLLDWWVHGRHEVSKSEPVSG
jgi:predicted PurR-regulated permease PerM